MAGVLHKRLVIHSRGAYPISHRSKTPPKTEFQLSIAFDKGATNGVTGMSRVRFSKCPHKTMGLDYDSDNFGSGVENRDDVS